MDATHLLIAKTPMLNLSFDESKATEAAAFLLSRSDQTMNYHEAYQASVFGRPRGAYPLGAAHKHRAQGSSFGWPAEMCSMKPEISLTEAKHCYEEHSSLRG